MATTTTKPANMALMTEKNELKDVFAKFNRHLPAATKKHPTHAADDIVLELEPEDEQPKGHLAGGVKSEDNFIGKCLRHNNIRMPKLMQMLEPLCGYIYTNVLCRCEET